jgi:hypothetical protein
VAVKESLPVAEKKPVMESARAMAALHKAKAKAVNTTRRLGMFGLRGEELYSESFRFLADAL